MTNAPANPAAPLDLSNPTAQVVASAAEGKPEYTGTITVGPHTYTTVKKLSALDMVILQEAQDSGSFRQIIEAVPRLVVKDQRQALTDYLLSDPDDDDDKVSLDDVLEALEGGLAQIAARPTDK